MSFKILIFVLVPCVLNVVLAGLAVFDAETFNANEVACYVAALSSILATIPTWAALFARVVGPVAMLLAIVTHSACVVTVCAAIHFGYDHGDLSTPDNDFITALYFSIVTWTTVGYGDFAPAPGLRLLAALQALAGYIFLGLIVSLVVSISLSKPSASPPQKEALDAPEPDRTPGKSVGK